MPVGKKSLHRRVEAIKCVDIPLSINSCGPRARGGWWDDR